MTHGHGDDTYKYSDIRINFSSNVYNHFNHDGLKNHLIKHFDKISNYPEPAPQTLETALASELSIKPDEVMACSGATEAIYLIAQAFQGSTSLILQPTFAEYADACRANNHKLTTIFQLPPTSFDFGLLWICCPNNPTGTVTPLESLLKLIKENEKTVFVVDASYAPFTSEPLLSAREAVKLPNVIMLHSMTKQFSIPGLRLGYATANTTLLSKIRAQRMPWSVNALAQEAGLYLLNHKADYKLDIDSIISERQRVTKALQQTGKMTISPSDSHMILCQLNEGTAAELKERLATRHGILIRDASNFSGLSQRHFRIAIQSPDENDQLIKALKDET